MSAQTAKRERAYRAMLDGDRVEWIDAPPQLDGPTEVQVTIACAESESERRERGRRMADALQRAADASAALAELAALGGIKSIPDPAAWQREIRKDRPLPGRED